MIPWEQMTDTEKKPFIEREVRVILSALMSSDDPAADGIPNWIINNWKILTISVDKGEGKDKIENRKKHLMNSIRAELIWTMKASSYSAEALGRTTVV